MYVENENSSNDESLSDDESEEDSKSEVDEDNLQELVFDMQEDDQALSGSLVEKIEEKPFERNEMNGENIVSKDNDDNENDREEESSRDEDEATYEVRPSTTRDAPERLDPTWGGKSYAQIVKDNPMKTKPTVNDDTDTSDGWITVKPKCKKTMKTIRFEDDETNTLYRSESCQTLIHQTIDSKIKVKYDKEAAFLLLELWMRSNQNQF